MRTSLTRWADIPPPSGPPSASGSTAPSSSSSSSSSATVQKLATSTAPKIEKPIHPALAPLRFLGIPPSLLRPRRPKLPSRNWLIFWSIILSTTYLYVDDRRKAKAIKEEYVRKVKWLAEAPLGTKESVRKVDVFSCKWPGDDAPDGSSVFFRRYIKPILVAAAIDYEHKNGNQHGAISDLIRDRTKDTRRALLGLPPITPPTSNPFQPPPTPFETQRNLENALSGGTILVGRHTFKEYMHGLREGWSVGLEKVDEDEVLAKALSEDGKFDEVLSPSAADADASLDERSMANAEKEESTSVISKFEAPAAKPPSSLFAPLGSLHQPPKPSSSSSQSQSSLSSSQPLENSPPSSIPPQPPLLLVEYPTLHGFRNIPWMIADFFNERKKVRLGAEAAYRLVMGETRKFEGPREGEVEFVDVGSNSSVENENDSTPDDTSNSKTEGTQAQSGERLPVSNANDLSFALSSESTYGPTFSSLPKTISKSRTTYYTEVLPKLALARAIARGEHSLTKDEEAYPPPTEVELREERVKKERKWRSDLGAWGWLKGGVGVVWDTRFGGEGYVGSNGGVVDVLRVFSGGVDAEERFSERREEWERVRKEREEEMKRVERESEVVPVPETD